MTQHDLSAALLAPIFIITYARRLPLSSRAMMGSLSVGLTVAN